MFVLFKVSQTVSPSLVTTKVVRFGETQRERNIETRSTRGRTQHPLRLSARSLDFVLNCTLEQLTPIYRYKMCTRSMDNFLLQSHHRFRRPTTKTNLPVIENMKSTQKTSSTMHQSILYRSHNKDSILIPSCSVPKSLGFKHNVECCGIDFQYNSLLDREKGRRYGLVKRYF